MLVHKVSPWNTKVTQSDIHWLYGCGTMINITFPAVVSPFNRGGAFWHMTSILYGTFTTSLSSFYCHFPFIMHQLILVFVALLTMWSYGEREMRPINWFICIYLPNTTKYRRQWERRSRRTQASDEYKCITWARFCFNAVIACVRHLLRYLVNSASTFDLSACHLKC